MDGKDAAETLERATVIWQALVTEELGQEENLRGLASAQFSAFDQAEPPDHDRAVVHMQRALEAFDRLLAARPAELDRKRNVALCHKCLATHFLPRNLMRAYEHSHRAAELDSERVLTLRRELFEADRANVHARYYLAHTLERVAEMHVLAAGRRWRFPRGGRAGLEGGSLPGVPAHGRSPVQGAGRARRGWLRTGRAEAGRSRPRPPHDVPARDGA